MTFKVKYMGFTVNLIFILLICCACFYNESKQVNEKEESYVDKQDIEIAIFEGGYGKAFYNKLKQSFEADYPQYNVVMIASPKIVEIITPRLVSGNPPDLLCEYSVDRFGDMAKDGALEPLNDFFDMDIPGEKNTVKDKVLNFYALFCDPLNDGTLYYAPTSGNFTNSLYYNKKLFRDNGFELPTTWDEFFKLGDECKQKGYALLTYPGLYPNYLHPMIFNSIASHVGLQELKDIYDYKKDAWRNPKVKEVLSILETIAKGRYLMPNTMELNHTQAQERWIKGDALFLPCGIWLENEMKGIVPDDFEYGCLTYPLFNKNEESYANLGFGGFTVVPTKARNKEGAKLLLAYSYRDDMVKAFTKYSNGISPVKNRMKIVGDLASDFMIETYNATKDLKSINMREYVLPYLKIRMADEMLTPISWIMTGQITVDNWVEILEKKTEIARLEYQNIKKDDDNY